MINKTDDNWILSKRGKKNAVDPLKPYDFLVEKERTSSGTIEDVAIIFLTNRECPFHCLMCDLWKNTTDKTVPPGAIPRQIEWALNHLPRTKHIKLYNSGSFFDPGAIPEGDYREIASLLNGFDTVIVESHPRLINEKCLTFNEMLGSSLQVAIGLETSDPDILARLNKKMTPDDFSRSVLFLSENGIGTRAFILLKPPFLSEPEGVLGAQRSLDFAFSCGVECCVVIPVRTGNGALEELAAEGYFTPPVISSLEQVLEYGIRLKAGRVFADLWDLHRFSNCDQCFDKRSSRISEMNLNQIIIPRIECMCNS